MAASASEKEHARRYPRSEEWELRARATAFSLYVVYVLEIVKSSNQRRFRLGRRHDELDERRSA